MDKASRGLFAKCSQKLSEYDRVLQGVIVIASILFLVLLVLQLLQGESFHRRFDEVQTCMFGNCSLMAKRFGINLTSDKSL